MKEERDLREMDLKWERDRLSKQLGGNHDADTDEQPEPQPLSRNELKLMLRRDRAPKETK